MLVAPVAEVRVRVIGDSREPKLGVFLKFAGEALNHASIVALFKRFELSVHFVHFLLRVYCSNFLAGMLLAL